MLKLYNEDGNQEGLMRQFYKNVFDTAEGRIVFADIMKFLGTFSAHKPTDVEAHALQSAGRCILSNLSPFVPNDPALHDSLIEASMDALLKIPIPKVEEE